MYGGQGANAFVSGLGQGYGVVDKALNSKQNRDIKGFQQDRAEEIYALAQQKKDQLNATNNQTDTAISAETKQTMDETKVNQKATNANLASAATNGIVGASTVEENDDKIADANTLFKNNPSLAKTMGFGPRDTIEKMDLSLPRDKMEYNKNLSNLGVTPASMGYDLNDPEDKKAWETLQTDMQPLLSMIKVGDNYINAENLGIATKSGSRASAEQNKKMADTKVKQETVIKKATNLQLDKKMADTKAKADAAGVYFNPDALSSSTPEEKTEIIDQVNKSIRQTATKDPMAGTETNQMDYKGGNQGLPTTEAMVNGELVKVDEGGAIVDAKGKPVVTKNPDGSKSTQKAGEEKGTTITTTTKPDGTTEEVTTEDQDLTKPNTSKATQNEAVVEASIQTQISRGTEPSDEYMRHLYALAGKTYPIPDKGQKIKNFEFMRVNGATNDQAMSAIFPKAKTADHRTELQKNIAGYKTAVKAGDKDTMAIYEAKFAKDSHIKAETSTAPEVVQLNNALKNLDPSSKEYKNIQGQIDKINYITPAKRGEYLDLIAQQKLVSTDSKEWKDLENRKLKLTEQSTKDKEHSLALKERNALDPDSPTFKEDYKRITARMNKLEHITGGGSGDGGRLAKANKFTTRIGVQGKDFKVTAEHLEEARGLTDDAQRKTFKKEIGEMVQLKNAYTESAELVSDLQGDGYDTGWMPSLEGAVVKAIPTSQFNKLSDTKKAEELRRITGNTKAGMILSNYLRSISGTAVADAEYKRLADIFNSKAYSNKSSYEAAVKQFAKGIKGTLRNQAKSLVDDIPLKSLELLKATEGEIPDRAEGAPAAITQGKVVDVGNGNNVQVMAISKDGKIFKGSDGKNYSTGVK